MSDDIDEGRIDLVPMIDCIMLLLLFFILTTKFNSEEKAISSLLPTDKGQANAKPNKVEEAKQVNICIYPSGMEKGYQPSEYRDALLKMRQSGQSIDTAWLRIGNAQPVEIDGKSLGIKDGSKLTDHINSIHRFIGDNMERYEVPGERKDQTMVIVHCFSGMSWRFALLAYDAVRYYEGQHAPAGFKYTGDPNQLLSMREVTFAPPRIRNYSPNELGNELFEIIHMK
jgi:hypothetical protein